MIHASASLIKGPFSRNLLLRKPNIIRQHDIYDKEIKNISHTKTGNKGVEYVLYLTWASLKQKSTARGKKELLMPKEDARPLKR
jgi:hypothetical protein